MKYLQLSSADREAVLARLEDMPDFLATRLADLPTTEATRPGSGGTFSPVEQAWHLADLEREGFAERIARLQTESDPLLPDFDGARIARERAYRTRSLAEGMARFRDARRETLATLRAMDPQLWGRGGTQDGVGAITLCDVPAMMAEHDAGHRDEIEAWLRDAGTRR